MTVDVPRISARVRILLWLLVVMTVALGAVAVTVRSILHRDVEHRISQLLSQETGEFVNFVAQGVDPDTGRSFGDPRRLLQTFLQRQYADPDEELLGLPRSSTNGPDVIRQRRDFPDHIALWRDEKALSRIVASKDSSGTLHRSQGELRWAKVSIRPLGDEPRGAFVVAFHADRERAVADQTFWTLLVLSGMALVLVSGIGWAVAGRILRGPGGRVHGRRRSAGDPRRRHRSDPAGGRGRGNGGGAGPRRRRPTRAVHRDGPVRTARLHPLRPARRARPRSPHRGRGDGRGRRTLPRTGRSA